MTREEIGIVLRGFVSDYRLSPGARRAVLSMVPDEGTDAETLGDIVDGQGYPELAEEIYEIVTEGQS